MIVLCLKLNTNFVLYITWNSCYVKGVFIGRLVYIYSLYYVFMPTSSTFYLLVLFKENIY